MLVLVAGQGLGKSKFAEWLCSSLPKYFIDSAINPESIDHQRWATGSFVWEVGELGATTRKADIEALKSFITRPEHSYRVPYARTKVNKLARASWIGTINPDNSGFLTDVTGDRRFLSIELQSIDWEGYTKNISVDQVWAQACAIYAENKDAWKLDSMEVVTRKTINEDFSIEDPVCEMLQSLCTIVPNCQKYEGQFTSSLDLVELLSYRIKHSNTRGLQMDIARALKRLNIIKGVSANKAQQKGYWGISINGRSSVNGTEPESIDEDRRIATAEEIGFDIFDAKPEEKPEEKPDENDPDTEENDAGDVDNL
jgi:hypothetical protein